MSPAPLGRLEVICGPMFSGKTTELIRRLALHAQRSAFVAFKPLRDDRYHAENLATHTGALLSARGIHTAAELFPACTGVEVVGIDEAHFFGAALIEPCITLITRGAIVIIAGVERDHRGNPFEPFPRLLCEADEVLKLSGPCALCGRPAIHSQRMIESSDAIVVGGADLYQARCRACFTPPREP